MEELFKIKPPKEGEDLDEWVSKTVLSMVLKAPSMNSRKRLIELITIGNIVGISALCVLLARYNAEKDNGDETNPEVLANSYMDAMRKDVIASIRATCEFQEYKYEKSVNEQTLEDILKEFDDTGSVHL